MSAHVVKPPILPPLLHPAVHLQVLPYASRSLYFHDLSILNVAAPNGDGIDPTGSADVLIERVNISTSDDAIAIKSGTVPGFAPTTNVTIRHSTLRSTEACVGIGSEMASDVIGVHVYNITCEAAGHAPLYIKERKDAGGVVANVVFENVTLGPGIIAKGLWLSQHFGENGEKVGKVGAGSTTRASNGSSYPVMRNITLRHVWLVAGGGAVIDAAVVAGDLPTPGPGGVGTILGVTLEDVHFGAPLLGWQCANASGVWRNVTPTPCSAFTPELSYSP